MHKTFKRNICRYAGNLTSDLRELLIVGGLKEHVIESAQLGFDGQFITLPVTEAGFFEYYEIMEDGSLEKSAIQANKSAAFGMAGGGSYTLVAPSALEALLLRSFGIEALAVAGGGKIPTELISRLRRARDLVIIESGPEALKRIPEAIHLHLPSVSLTAFFIDAGLEGEDFRKLVKEAICRNSSWL